MRIFCYFVEPASYTLDMARNIHDKNQIDYCFIKSETLSVSNSSSNKVFLDRLSLFRKLKYLLSQFKRSDLIIIHGYNSYPFIITFLLNLFSLRKRFIATDSDTQLSITKNLLKRLLKWAYLSIVFRNKHVLGFAGGSKTHKELFRYYGMLEDRIFLMPMMVDNKKFYCDKKVFPKPFTFLYVGRLLDTKNVDVLCERFINAFSDKNVELIIVGGGDNLSKFKKQYSHEKIQFKGSIFGENLIKLYHNSSAFVFPSSVEAWGLVINEALSAGLPVIANEEVGACFDLIKDKETGFIAADIEEFGKMMLTLFNDAELLKRYSKNASDLMKNNWNYDLYYNCLNKAMKKVEQWQ
jgi:glycosyltransferase involved in cell wall biosynthesis